MLELRTGVSCMVCETPHGNILGVNHWAAGGDSAAPRLEHSDGHSFPSAQPRAGEIYQRVICRMRHATKTLAGCQRNGSASAWCHFERGKDFHMRWSYCRFYHILSYIYIVYICCTHVGWSCLVSTEVYRQYTGPKPSRQEHHNQCQRAHIESRCILKYYWYPEFLSPLPIHSSLSYDFIWDSLNGNAFHGWKIPQWWNMRGPGMPEVCVCDGFDWWCLAAKKSEIPGSWGWLEALKDPGGWFGSKHPGFATLKLRFQCSQHKKNQKKPVWCSITWTTILVIVHWHNMTTYFTKAEFCLGSFYRGPTTLQESIAKSKGQKAWVCQVLYTSNMSFS